MCYLRSMEYTYCSVCPRLCHVRSKLRRGTDRFCSGSNEFTAHLCYITRQRMAGDEQACREANERAEGRMRLKPRRRGTVGGEGGEGEGGGRGRGGCRRLGWGRMRMGGVMLVRRRRREGMVRGWCRIIRGGGGTMGGGWIMGLGGLGLEYGGGGGGRVERGVVRVAMG